jgi:hypothetical protein
LDYDDQSDNTAVLCPGGRVVATGVQWWDDEAAWVQDMQDRAKAEKEKATPAA